MDWKVVNAVNRDVEREHLNKILKDIRTRAEELTAGLANVGDGLNQQQQTLTNTIVKVVNNIVPEDKLVTKVTLLGEVTGTSVPVPGKNEVTINCEINANFVEEAPVDSYLYWRGQGQWQQVPYDLLSITEIAGSGIVVRNEEGPNWLLREIVGDTSAERIVVTNGDGLDDNPQIDLALVADGGVAPTLLKVTRDAYGRVNNTTLATATDVPIAVRPGATWDNLQEFINVMNSPGLVEGGSFTDAGSGNLAYGSMRIAIRPTDGDTSTLYMADIAAGSIAIPNDSLTRFVGVQYNAGTPNVVLKTADTWDYDTEFPIGEVANLGGTLFPLFNPFKVGDPITNIIQRFDAQATAIRSSAGGLELSTDGTTRNLAMTAGTIWARLNDFAVAARDSTVLPLYRVTPTGSTPPLSFTPGFTAWPNTQYLSGTTLTTMTNNRWANLWVFVNIGTGAWGFAHGTAQYNNSSGAAAEQVPSYLTANFLRQNLLVGRLIFEKNATTAIIESAFTRVFSVQPVSNHNQLSGLQGGVLGEYYHLTASELADAQSAVQSVTAGTNVTVDNTDPRNPVISATGGGGSSFVPYNIADGQTFAVPADQQALFTLAINLGNGSSIDLEGALVEVS